MEILDEKARRTPGKPVVKGLLAGLTCAGWIVSSLLRLNAFALSQVEFMGSFDLRREIRKLGPQARLRLSKMLDSSGRLYSLLFAGRSDGGCPAGSPRAESRAREFPWCPCGSGGLHRDQ
jgi:hypothetical protein